MYTSRLSIHKTMIIFTMHTHGLCALISINITYHTQIAHN